MYADATPTQTCEPRLPAPSAPAPSASVATAGEAWLEERIREYRGLNEERLAQQQNQPSESTQFASNSNFQTQPEIRVINQHQNRQNHLKGASSVNSMYPSIHTNVVNETRNQSRSTTNLNRASRAPGRTYAERHTGDVRCEKCNLFFTNGISINTHLKHNKTKFICE
jgi:hypothetical protein